MESKLEIRGLAYAYEAADAISDVSLYAAEGEFVGLIGPNGCGKSTTLKCVYGALRPREGEIFLDGRELTGLSARERAAHMAVVGQENELTFDFRVEEIVAMGRNPHKRLFQADTAEDRGIVSDALAKVGMGEFSQRSFRSLSGGEKQRVLIARAIAQRAGLMILDEPTNHLDISYQLSVFETVRGLGVTTLAAIHDMNLASLFCDRIYVMRAGRVFAWGTPAEMITPGLIKEVFGVTADIHEHQHTGRPHAAFIPGEHHHKGETK